MGFTTRKISISQLMLDQDNPRLGESQPDQASACLALARAQGDFVLTLASDIVNRGGLDPMAMPGVVPDPVVSGRYKVLEGNRRVLALKALRKPAIIEEALTPGRSARLKRLAEAFKAGSTNSINCAVFDSEDEAWPWIELRHTGANNGIGLWEWDSNEIDRFRIRHGSAQKRKPAGQVLDFVNRVAPTENGSNRGIITNITRFLSSVVRKEIGLEFVKGVVYSWYPTNEIFKPLNKLVSDLRNEKIKVKHVYDEDEREKYLAKFGEDDLPNPEMRLRARIELDLLGIAGETSPASVNDPIVPDIKTENGNSTQAATSGAQTRNSGNTAIGASSASNGSVGATASASNAGRNSGGYDRPRPPRTTTIPKNLGLGPKIPKGRIRDLYSELIALEMEQFPNLCAVGLRVFVELSVDNYIIRESVMTPELRRTWPLSRRLKETAAHMKNAGLIVDQLESAVIKVANGNGPFSTTTLNQYVHNEFVLPKPSEIRTYWDELEPFVKQLWAT